MPSMRTSRRRVPSDPEVIAVTYLPAYAALLLGVLAAARVCADAADWFAGGEPPAYLRPLLRRSAAAGEPVPVVVEELELARLSRELARVRGAAQPGLQLRLRAVTMAYDETLLRCAAHVGVAVRHRTTPLPDEARFELETTLIGHGLSW